MIRAARFSTDRAAMIVPSFSVEHRWFAEYAAFCTFLGHQTAPGQTIDKALPSRTPLTLALALAWVASPLPVARSEADR